MRVFLLVGCFQGPEDANNRELESRDEKFGELV
jgi:hypothetical protein